MSQIPYKIFPPPLKRGLLEPAEEQTQAAFETDISYVRNVFMENMHRYRTLVSGEILSGPVSFSFFPYFYGKALYILGDRHEESSECRDVSVVSAKAKTIDYFLNEHFSLNTLPRGKGYMDFFFEHFIPEPSKRGLHWERHEGNLPIKRINRQFKSCLNSSSKTTSADCEKWKKTRFHSSDIRCTGEGVREPTIVRVLYILSAPGAKILNTLRAFQVTGLDLTQYVNTYFTGANTMNSSLVDSSHSISKAIAHKQRGLETLAGRTDLMFSRRLHKELSNSYLQSEIINWAQSQLLEVSNAIDTILNSKIKIADAKTVKIGDYGCSKDKNGRISKLGDDITINEWSSILLADYTEKELTHLSIPSAFLVHVQHLALQLHIVYLKIGVLLTDVYTLSRIFKLTTINNNSREVWIYVGDYHATNIKSFLAFTSGRHTDNISVSSPTITSNKQCILVKDLKPNSILNFSNLDKYPGLAVVYDATAKSTAYRSSRAPTISRSPRCSPPQVVMQDTLRSGSSSPQIRASDIQSRPQSSSLAPLQRPGSSSSPQIRASDIPRRPRGSAPQIGRAPIRPRSYSPRPRNSSSRPSFSPLVVQAPPIPSPPIRPTSPPVGQTPQRPRGSSPQVGQTPQRPRSSSPQVGQTPQRPRSSSPPVRQTPPQIRASDIPRRPRSSYPLPRSSNKYIIQSIYANDMVNKPVYTSTSMDFNIPSAIIPTVNLRPGEEVLFFTPEEKDALTGIFLTNLRFLRTETVNSNIVTKNSIQLSEMMAVNYLSRYFRYDQIQIVLKNGTEQFVDIYKPSVATWYTTILQKYVARSAVD
jgi:hypothetical protein